MTTLPYTSVCISVSIKPVEDQMGGVSSAERRNSGGASGITAVSQSVRPPPHASQTPRADLFSLVTNIVSPGANDIASSALPQRHVIHTPCSSTLLLLFIPLSQSDTRLRLLRLLPLYSFPDSSQSCLCPNDSLHSDPSTLARSTCGINPAVPPMEFASSFSESTRQTFAAEHVH